MSTVSAWMPAPLAITEMRSTTALERSIRVGACTGVARATSMLSAAATGTASAITRGFTTWGATLCTLGA